MVRKTQNVNVSNLRGGEGTLEIRHILSQEELMGHGTMYAHVVIPQGGSIGFHQHVGNTEPYYILKGNGVFTDNDGSRTSVSAGDVCVIQPGESHALENTGDQPLEVLALVINERA